MPFMGTHAVMLKTVSDAASWLLRTLLVDATGAWLFMAVFAAGTLLHLPEIESGLAAQKPGWSRRSSRARRTVLRRRARDS